MEWTESLATALKYIEDHIYDDINADDLTDIVYMSSFYFQKGFKIITGYSIGEYIRCRRLYLAALDVIDGNNKVIDLAYKYHYDTPESFTKAFTRFHGISPIQLKKDHHKLKPFLPLRISITIQGGNEMDYTIEHMEAMEVIGFIKDIKQETAYQDIPQAWNEFTKVYCEQPNEFTELKKTCCVGEFGICIDDGSVKDGFRYLMAGRYHGEEVPQGMMVYQIPEATYVKFRCSGPLPVALQSVNTQIYKEWLPQHPEYIFDGCMNLEWYSKGDMSASDYQSEIWIPVKKRG